MTAGENMPAGEGTPVEPAAAATGTPRTPALGRGVAQVQQMQIRVDAMPSSLEALARLTPEQRSAIYLNQIRKMMIFFVILAVIGIIAGVILGIVDINTVRNSQQSGVGLGY
jgi:hypothetical protein